MNSKKARQLRQLVAHLQNKDTIENKEWTLAKDVHNKGQKLFTTKDALGNVREEFITTSIRKLDAGCGRAIYQQMKKRVGKKAA